MNLKKNTAKGMKNNPAVCRAQLPVILELNRYACLFDLILYIPSTIFS